MQNSENYLFQKPQVKIQNFENAFQSVFRISPIGSAVLVSDQGIVITAGHVIRKNTLRRNFQKLIQGDKQISLNNSKLLYWGDGINGHDLAVLYVPELVGAKHIKVATAPLKENDPIVLLGYPTRYFRIFPWFLPKPSEPKLIKGIYLDEEDTDFSVPNELPGKLSSYRLLSYSGHSGGPILNAKGELVGILNSGSSPKLFESLEGVVSYGPSLEDIKAILNSGVDHDGY